MIANPQYLRAKRLCSGSAALRRNNGIHDRAWTNLESGQGRKWKMGHHIRGRLHVLVIAREKVWLVRGTKLLRHRQRKVARCECRLSHRYLLMAATIRLRRKVGRDGVPRPRRLVELLLSGFSASLSRLSFGVGNHCVL